MKRRNHWIKRDKEKGSVVVEATLSLSCFMFFIVTLLTLINICTAQAKVAVALNESAKEISQYGYIYGLTGLNQTQQEQYGYGETNRADIDDCIEAANQVKDALVDISTVPTSVDDAWDKYEKAKNAKQTVTGTADTIYKNIKKNPQTYCIGLLKTCTNEAEEGIKGAIAGAIAKGLMYKHLSSETGQDPDKYLKHLGIKKGMDGLNLMSSSVFTNGSDDITFVCKYDIQVIKLLNIDYNYHISQVAKTMAWSGDSLVRDTGSSENSNSGDGEATSDDNKPEEGEDKPEDGEDKPEDGEDKPEEGEDKPEEGEDKPEDGEDKPEDGEDKPEEGEDKPEEDDDKPKDPYEAKREEMVKKYGEKAVAAIEKEYGDETKEWDDEIWSIAAIIYAMDNNCPEILDEKERCEYEKEVNKRYGMCFVAGIQVKTAEGNKNIEDIEVGDKVFSYDVNTGEQALNSVTTLFVHEEDELIDIELEDVDISTTAPHMFYVLGEGFKKASDLKVGDSLYLLDGTSADIDEITYRQLDEPVNVYNFSVENYHTYYVSDVGVLVHNECPAAIRQRAVKDYSEDVVKELEKTYGDDVTSKWNKETWDAAAMAEALKNGRRDILPDEQKAEYDKIIKNGGTIDACFVAGTQIKTPEGNKNIEDIEVGDDVYSCNYCTGEQGIKDVADVFVHDSNIIVNVEFDDENICTTYEHPFYVLGEGFKAAAELQIGDSLCLLDGTNRNVESISFSYSDTPVRVYNFEVEDWHTYYVSDTGVLVHNKCNLKPVNKEGDTTFVGEYRKDNKLVIEPNVKMETRESTIPTPAERKKVDTEYKSRKKEYLNDLAEKHADELRKAGITDAEIDLMRQGKNPSGYQVHHIVPREFGGDNSDDNLVLIRTDPYHFALTTYQSDQPKGQPGEKVTRTWPVPSGTVYPPK
ncbi:polymorphic toxin-type HINT domain-containing protein [Butyrivibrio sp. FC2001]|uniref:polymorphic toxin-type HINT domain-containing protein n=1 Tax=Butyrivibrio sp. FC2001 TaxID=1280671 RepID=UPI000418429D|nr:polymorphic toxin-type HINT domain-containing protein [Butyrivibrio sp. FC2001]